MTKSNSQEHRSDAISQLPSGPVAQGDTMQPGEILNPDESIWSANRQYRFIYQTDGNLVLYEDGSDGRSDLWASGTDGSFLGVCIMQDDGNLVVYDADAQRVWASGTRSSGSRLVVQDDGNVVIYAPVWDTTSSTVLRHGEAAKR